jgi:hypothetical protein
MKIGDPGAHFHGSEECKTYLWLDQHQVDEQHDEIMLHIFVGEAFAAWTLCETHTFTESLVIGFAVCGVERTDWIATLDTDWHVASVGLVVLCSNIWADC